MEYPPFDNGPPELTSNKEIRALAWQLTRYNYGKLLAASALLSLATVLSTLIGNGWTDFFIQTLLTSIISFIFAPLSCGAAVYFYKIYIGEEDAFGSIFNFYKSRRTIITTCLLQSVHILMSVAVSWPYHLYTQVQTTEKSTLFPVLFIPLFLLLLYFTLRLLLTSYILGCDPSQSVGAVLKASMSATKGKVHTILWFALTLIGWIFVPLVIVASVLRDTNVVTGVIQALIFLCAPYFALAIAGLAHNLMPVQKEQMNIDDMQS